MDERDELQKIAAEGFSVDHPPARLRALAAWCCGEGERQLDVRYFVLSDCLQIIDGFWGGSDAGGVSAAFGRALDRLVASHLGAVLAARDEEEGVALAQAFREELRVLGYSDPLGYSD